MKNLAILALATAAVSANAVVTVSGPFFAPAPLIETFDAVAAGTYNVLNVFSVPAMAQAIGPGQLVVRPYPGVNTFPHLLYGDQADVRIISKIPMRRFGGFFNSGFLGVFSSTATFRFYDATNTFIGQQTVPMTTAMAPHYFVTNPKWHTVEIFGNVPGFPGAVGMDSLRIRPN